MRTAALLALLLLLGSPGGDDGLTLVVRTEVTRVALGEGFPLTVTRRWPRDLLPLPWPDDALAPLVLRRLSTTRREDGDFVEETWACRAHALALGTVTVTPAPLRARTVEGAEVTASAPPLQLEVTPVLPPEAAKAAELPADPVAVPRPWWPWVVLVLAGYALLASAGPALRRRQPPPPPEPGIPSDARARRRLAALPPPADDADLRPDAIAMAAILREELTERFGVPATARTTPEIELLPRLDPARRRHLMAVLHYCDRVKFGRGLPDRSDRAHALGAAEAWLAPEGGR